MFSGAGGPALSFRTMYSGYMGIQLVRGRGSWGPRDRAGASPKPTLSGPSVFEAAPAWPAPLCL